MWSYYPSNLQISLKSWRNMKFWEFASVPKVLKISGFHNAFIWIWMWLPVWWLNGHICKNLTSMLTRRSLAGKHKRGTRLLLQRKVTVCFCLLWASSVVDSVGWSAFSYLHKTNMFWHCSCHSIHYCEIPCLCGNMCAVKPTRVSQSKKVFGWIVTHRGA